MKFVCPKVDIWAKIYLNLLDEWKKNGSIGTEPPRVLILGAWAMSDDYDKNKTWNETVLWADRNNLSHIIPQLKEDEKLMTHFYVLSMYKYLDFTERPPKYKPTEEEVKAAQKILIENWGSYLGSDFAVNTMVKRFTGRKKRRLVVYVKDIYNPPWGTWKEIKNHIIFSEFRKKINIDISPLEIDHIDFISTAAFR